MAHLEERALDIVIGTYAQARYLPDRAKTLTGTVAQWDRHLPDRIPLPHPSPRNTPWLRKNPWFEAGDAAGAPGASRRGPPLTRLRSGGDVGLADAHAFAELGQRRVQFVLPADEVAVLGLPTEHPAGDEGVHGVGDRTGVDEGDVAGGHGEAEGVVGELQLAEVKARLGQLAEGRGAEAR